MAQPPLLGGLVEPGRGHEAVGPGDQLLAMRGRARAQHVELLRRGDQRILAALVGVEHRIEQALAHAERGDHDVLRARDVDQMLQHQRRIGEQRPPRVGHHLDLRQRLGVHPMHEAGEVERLARRTARSRASRAADSRSATCAGAPATARCRRWRRRCGPCAGLRAAAPRPAPCARACSAFLIDFAETSCSARPPSGSVMPVCTLWPWTSESSSEPPPRSPTRPSGR